MEIAIVSMLVLSAFTQAAMVKFNVIAPGETTVQVSVNGQVTALSTINSTIPLFTGSAEAGSDNKYKYIASGRAEGFERTLPTGNSTYNDFLGHPITCADTSELPWRTRKSLGLTMSERKQGIFDVNYIPTIFVNGSKADFDSLITTSVSIKIPVTLTIVLADEVKTISNAEIFINGVGKKNSKQSWNFRLLTGTIYQERNLFRLHYHGEDLAWLHGKLYADVGRVTRSYTHGFNAVRMFINGDAIGDFSLLDDITEYSCDAMFLTDKPLGNSNAPVDAAYFDSFAYSLNDPEYYPMLLNKSASINSITALICKKLRNTTKTNDDTIAEIDKMLDLIQHIQLTYLRNLTGN
ncbi:hypothetical protein EC991_003248 [Linnemannia zychae]|nr:hypothetical protein EC991_003248 [Linnemannia zychae]